jgi:hypothetical protein
MTANPAVHLFDDGTGADYSLDRNSAAGMAGGKLSTIRGRPPK